MCDAEQPGRKMSPGVNSNPAIAARDHPAERFMGVRHTFRLPRTAGSEIDEHRHVGLRRRQVERRRIGCQYLFEARLSDLGSAEAFQGRTKFGRRVID